MPEMYFTIQPKTRICHLQQHYAHGRMLAQESKENLSNRIFEVNLTVPCYSANFQGKKKKEQLL